MTVYDAVLGRGRRWNLLFWIRDTFYQFRCAGSGRGWF